MAKGGFPGGRFPGAGNMNQMLKQAQKMQEELQKQQEEMEATEFSATVGGGAVTATVTGRKALSALTIAKEAVDPDDVEMLQDMIISAVNEAMKKVDEKNAESMGKLTGGMNLPGLF